MANKTTTGGGLLNAIVNRRIKTQKGSPYWEEIIQRAIRHEVEETAYWRQQYDFDGCLDDDCSWNSWMIAYEVSRDLRKFYTETWGDAPDCTEKPRKPPAKELREADKRLKKARLS